MGLEDYRLGGTVIIRGAEAAAAGLNRVWQVSRKLMKGLYELGSKATRVVWDGFKSLTRNLGIASAATLGAIKVYADFQTQIARVGTLLDDGRQAMGMFGDAVQKMSIDTGQSTEKIADGLFQAISAGVDSARATEFLGVANKAAVAGFTDLKNTVDGLTVVMNSYGLGVNEATNISDAFFVTNTKGRTTIQEISASIGAVAPLAAKLGVGYKELLAALISTSQVQSTSEAMNGLKAILAGILQPTADAEKLAKKLKITLGAGAIRKAGGLVEYMGELSEKTKGSTTKLSGLFGAMEAKVPILHLTGAGFGAMADGLKAMGDAAGLTDRKFQEVSETINFQLAQLKEASIAVVSEIGRGAAEGLGFDLRSIVGMVKDKLPEIRRVSKDFFGGLAHGVASTWKPALAELLKGLGVITTSTDGALGDIKRSFGMSESNAKSWGELVGKVLTGFIKKAGELLQNLGAIARAIMESLNTAGHVVGFITGKNPNDPGQPTFDANEVRRMAAQSSLSKRMGRSLSPGNFLVDALANGTLKPGALQAIAGFTPEAEAATRQDIANAVETSKRQFLDGQKKASRALGAERNAEDRAAAAAELARLTQEREQAASKQGVQNLKDFGGDIAAAARWLININVENKTQVVVDGDDKGGGSSSTRDHAERGAGDAVAEFRIQQKYLVTQGRVQSVPLEFITVRGAGPAFAP